MFDSIQQNKQAILDLLCMCVYSVVLLISMACPFTTMCQNKKGLPMAVQVVSNKKSLTEWVLGHVIKANRFAKQILGYLETK